MCVAASRLGFQTCFVRELEDSQAILRRGAGRGQTGEKAARRARQPELGNRASAPERFPRPERAGGAGTSAAGNGRPAANPNLFLVELFGDAVVLSDVSAQRTEV